MAAFFRRVSGKTCMNDGCTLRGYIAEPGQDRCERCDRPLVNLMAPNRFRQLATILLASSAFAGSGFEALKYFRPQPVQVELLPPSTSQAGVPNPLMANSQGQLGARLREIYRDCVAGDQESEEITKLLASNPGLAPDYEEFQRSRLPHILESCHKVRSGQMLVAQKLFEHARTDFLKATEEDPENASAWAALGGVDMLTHREEEAGQSYERALTVDPESWIAHYNYGFYFARKGETEAAFRYLDRAVALLSRSGFVDRAAVLDDLRHNPVLEPLRRDPRFARLLG